MWWHQSLRKITFFSIKLQVKVICKFNCSLFLEPTSKSIILKIFTIKINFKLIVYCY